MAPNSREYVPGPQGTQIEAPIVLLYVPGKQRLQDIMLVALENFPLMQSAHTISDTYGDVK